MSTLLLAIYFTSILSSWDASLALWFVPTDAAAAIFTAAGSTFTSPSMTTPALPSSRSCPPLPPLPPSPSCALQLLTTLPWVSPFVAYSPTMVTAIVPALSAPLSSSWVCAIASPVPTLRAPTEKPSVLSKLPTANGLTPALTGTLNSATSICFHGFTTTTGTVLMVASTMLHLSAALASTGTTS